MFEKKFKERLALQRQSGLYRNPPLIEKKEGKYLVVGGRRAINFSSNDYLGLSGSRKFAQIVADNFAEYGTSSSSSRLVTGNYSMISRAEGAYAEYFGYEDALFFPSGYQANLGVISSLFGNGDTIIFDKHIHASSVKGMTLSKAELLGYNHNSMAHLRKRLESRRENQVCVLTEALFSMDGDFLHLEGLKALKKEYGILAVVDEAHSFGALGDGGRGISRSVADIAVGTFGKAFGFFGAFALLPKGVKEYLFNFSSPLIYSTTLPEAHAASALELLDTISQCQKERDRLHRNSLRMREKLKEAGFRVNGDAHVLAIELGEEQLAAKVSAGLTGMGVFAFSARYPTVPLGKAILRVSMTALHNGEDIDLFIKALKEVHEKAQLERE